MNETCRREADVLRAAEEGTWSESLREHLFACEHCTAAASVAPWMEQFARIGDREHRLPDPSLVWIKAKLLQGSADANRAVRPLNAAQFLSYGLVAAGWTALLMWKWSEVEAWIHAVTPAGLVENAAKSTVSFPFLAMLVVLASMTVMLAMHTILAED